MNDATGNRLLKTLEEPPAFAHLILSPTARPTSCPPSSRAASSCASRRRPRRSSPPGWTATGSAGDGARRGPAGPRGRRARARPGARGGPGAARGRRGLRPRGAARHDGEPPVGVAAQDRGRRGGRRRGGDGSRPRRAPGAPARQGAGAGQAGGRRAGPPRPAPGAHAGARLRAPARGPVAARRGLRRGRRARPRPRHGPPRGLQADAEPFPPPTRCATPSASSTRPGRPCAWSTPRRSSRSRRWPTGSSGGCAPPRPPERLRDRAAPASARTSTPSPMR
jgi:hypothetical protein